RAVEADDLDLLAVGPRRRVADHRIPPEIAEVVLELDAERPVVPEPVDAAIDLGALENEATALAEGDQLLHQGRAGRGRHRGAVLSRRTGLPKAGEADLDFDGMPVDAPPMSNRIGIVPFWKSYDRATVLRIAELADDLGYDSIWVPEAWAYEQFQLLTEIAPRTKRLKLPTAHTDL